jgi:hypothetical protein
MTILFRHPGYAMGPPGVADALAQLDSSSVSESETIVRRGSRDLRPKL